LLVTVEEKWGVLEGAPLDIRQSLARCLNTETQIVGDRLKFVPTHEVLEYIRHQPNVEFDPACRGAWGHFYKKKKPRPEAKPVTDFEFKTRPYPHQQNVFLEIRDLPYYALFWEMGLGKTKEALDVAAWKYSTGKIDAVLVVTLKGVHRNWVTKEIPEHLPVEGVKAAYWNTNRVEGGMRGVLDHQGLVIATINFDAIHQPKGEAFCRKFLSNRKVLVIVDESHGIKTPSARRTKALIKLGKLAKARLIMTGTPITNAPLDLYSQLEFLAPSILGFSSYFAFKKRYAVEQEVPGVTHLEWRRDPITGQTRQIEVPTKCVVGYRHIEELKDRIQPFSSRLTKDEVLDLPPKVYRLHPFEMTDEQKKAYRSMKQDLLIELASGQRVSAQLAITKLLRLQQLACGFVVPDDMDRTNEDVTGIPFGKTNPRLESLLDIMEEVHGKAIIWTTFRHSLKEIVETLSAKYGRHAVAGYSGKTSQDLRQKIEQDFQDPAHPLRFFIGQPKAGGTGITLTQARDVVYYNNSFDLVLRLQSEDRAHRIGQTGTVTYTDLQAVGTVDSHITNALKNKRNLAAEITGDDLKAWLSSDD
jgi:SNF2 family DNA or RNA helicase